MKAWIVSDLHTSRTDVLRSTKLIVPRADICICAGDISNNIERSIDFLHAEIAPHMPVVAVLGNHDYYGSSIDHALEHARKWSVGTNVHILENEMFQKGDLRVVGATLWTDFEISHHQYGHLPIDQRRSFASQDCMRYLLDFRFIQQSENRIGDKSGLITPEEMMARHWESRDFIGAEVAKPFSGTTMVLTHHAVTPMSLNPSFSGQVSNAAFASDLTDVIRGTRPHFWVHGHIHRFADYVVGDTRVLCNPRGYFHEERFGGYKPGFVIETTALTDQENADV
jgi:predicted phosphohydrolase